MPSERYTDIVNYSWSGATRFDPNDINHKCSAKLYYETNFKGYSDSIQVVNYKEDHTIDYSGKINKNNNYTETTLCIPFDLPKNYYCTTSSDTVTKLKFTVTFELKKNGKELGIGYNYQHQIKKIDGWSAAVAVAGMTVTVIGGIINASYPILGKILVSAGIVTDIKNARSIAVASYNQVGKNARFAYQYK